ncbi:CD63 antigen-like [Wyeomyia smithii]|uniref:CD63 antigen-like n=1 Tax=Wyeomyia smithii TaxID=174621 RepID=UPI002467FA50|nr:CD63 antigen-like [Wyeomyia smithii]XP_055541248.1 CD63 antigen-like [Wyeomyia smithii]XP_055541249.1 CD63 antigen-like [Wyeomyia smithii]
MKHEHHTGSWSMKWIKFFLFMINVMFVFTAVLVISTGVAIQSVYSDFTSFIDEQFYSPTFMFISVGMITLLIAAFGFIGTIRESSLLINIYCGILSVVVLLEVTATLVGIYHRQEVSGILMESMSSCLQHYPWNNNMQDSVDYMQIQLKCCGVISYKDWSDVLTVDLLNDDLKSQLPASCCTAYLGGNCVPFQAGCHAKMYSILEHCSRTIISGILVVAFVQISAAMFAFALGKRIRQMKTKSSLDELKHANMIYTFDYKLLNESSVQIPKS